MYCVWEPLSCAVLKRELCVIAKKTPSGVAFFKEAEKLKRAGDCFNENVSIEVKLNISRAEEKL